MNTNWIDEFCSYLFPLDRVSLKIEEAYGLKQAHLPAAVYKYRSFNQYSLKNLEESTVWLSSPLKFNDPFDCAVTADVESYVNRNFVYRIPDEVIAKHQVPQSVMEEAKISEKPLHVMVQWMASTGKEGVTTENAAGIEEALAGAIRQQCDRLRDQIFSLNFENVKVCSFTTNPTSLLMWGHYAEQHRGFCIKYGLTGFDGRTDLRLRLLYPVIYSEDLVNVTEMLLTAREDFNVLAPQRAVLTKSKEWNYESEWRLVISGGIFKDDQAWPYLPAEAIYLGARIDDKNERDLIAIAERMNLSVFKMQVSKEKYGLEPRKIR